MGSTLAALAGLAFSAFASATLLPGTSEALLVALHVAGAAPAGALLLVASLANVAGSCVNWLLGRFIERFENRPWFPVDPARIIRAKAWFSRFGPGVLLFSWLPLVGDPLTLAAGVLRMRFLPFLICVAIAKTGRYVVILWLVDIF